MKASIYLLIFFLAQHLLAQDNIRPLEQFVGYYNVGVKPGKPFFKSRWYLKNDELYTIYDSDFDKKFEPYKDGKLNYNVFYDEKDLPEIAENDPTYYVILTFKDDRLEQFKIIRPRTKWPTDLYGYRMPELDELAVHAEELMTEEMVTDHFKFIYSKQDEAFVQNFSTKIESSCDNLLMEN